MISDKIKWTIVSAPNKEWASKSISRVR
ncbi:hypothetical protein Q5M85_18960 [Paraclostridium bifermentans]|nr:hypothetical protein [Paraclostridium bifermentans]